MIVEVVGDLEEKDGRIFWRVEGAKVEDFR